MFCRFCGKQIPDSSQFCEHCGRLLAASEKDGWRPAGEGADSRRTAWDNSGGKAERRPEPNRNNRRNVLIAAIAGGGVLVIALVVALALLLAPEKDPSGPAAAESPAPSAAGSAGGVGSFGPEGYFLGDPYLIQLEDGSLCAGLRTGVYRFTGQGAQCLLEGDYMGNGLCIGNGKLLAVRRESDEEHILTELDLATGEADDLYSCPADTVLAGKLGDTLYLLSPSQGIWGMDLISIAGDDTQTLVASEMGSASCGPFGILVEGYSSDVGPRTLHLLTEDGNMRLLSETCLDSSQAGGMLLVWECNASASNNYIWDEIILCDYSGNGGVQRLTIPCSDASAVPRDMYAQGSSIRLSGDEPSSLWVDYAGEYWFKAPLSESGGTMSYCLPGGDALYGFCFDDGTLSRLHLNMDAGKVESETAGTLPDDAYPLGIVDGAVYYVYFDSSRSPEMLELED